MTTAMHDTYPRFDAICGILNEMHEQHADAEWLEDFFELNDLGVPMAILYVLDAAEPTEAGIVYVHETWRNLCELLEVDPHGDYQTADDLINAAGINGLTEAPTEEITSLIASVQKMLDEER